jgi:HEAT repeat protein
MKALLQNMIAGSKPPTDTKSGFVKSARLLLVVGALAAIVGLMPDIASRAQRPKEGPATVASVSSRSTASGSAVTIAADTSLSRVQTWQDSEGYHVSFPYSGQGEVKGSKGVKVRQVGRSLEVVVQVKPGANVTVQPQSDRLTLQVDGSLDTTESVATEQTDNNVNRERENSANSSAAISGPSNPSAGSSDHNAPGNAASASPTSGSSVQSSNTPQTAVAPASGSDTAAPIAPAQDDVTAGDQSSVVVSTTNPDVPLGDQPAAESTGGSLLFSGPGVIGIVCLGLIGLFVIRRRNSSRSEDREFPQSVAPIEVPPVEREPMKDNRNLAVPTPAEPSLSLVKSGSTPDVKTPNAPSYASSSLFGAYRVDQEIGKLVLGQPHRMDVLASRASDDRRAMEVALIKALNSAQADEDGRRRARQALEEYGFVARQSATLLLGQDVCERASAARSLGEIGAPSSLPFLLEALYDNEPIVRNQCITSLGTLKLPSAIGALLDVARRHPSIPDTLLSNALSACSVESFDFFDVTPGQPALLAGDSPLFTGEITMLEATGVVNDLPDSVEDSALIEALALLESPDPLMRTTAVRQLAQFPVQRSVEALAAITVSDPEAAVRAAAVSCLGSIDHESGFAPILIAVADESREVRAAAARSLNGLSFDRADAYVRVIETASDETLKQVAQACIKAGMVAQAIDRLASNDRRQAYEAFSLVSLLAKANETQPIFEAIENHKDDDVRMCAVRVLGLAGQALSVQGLRQFAGRDDIPEAVRGCILEVIYKIDQAQPENSAK